MNKSILFCTGIFPPQIGGPATYVLKMAREMSKRGIKNAVITSSSNAENKDYGLKVYRVSWGVFALSYFKYFLKVLRIGKKYDIIYLQGSFVEGIPTIIANFFLRKKIVVRLGGIFAWEYCTNKGHTSSLPEEFYGKKQDAVCEIFKSIDRFVVSRCDAVLTNSSYMKKLLILNGINENKISVVYNSLDTINLTSKPREILLREFNLPDKKILLSHGRFVPWKNFDKLLSFSSALDDDYIVVVVGNGPEKNKLLDIIQKENLKDTVFILDRQSRENIRHLNQIAHIYVLLSSYEGSSNALLEVMQQNRPIIASNIEPNIETLADYENCKIININKAEFLKAVDFFANTESKIKPDLHRFYFEDIYKKTFEILCM